MERFLIQSQEIIGVKLISLENSFCSVLAARPSYGNLDVAPPRKMQGQFFLETRLIYISKSIDLIFLSLLDHFS